MLSVQGAQSTPIAQIFIDSSGNQTVQYLHDDHLGSRLQLITDGEGSLTGVLTFDPWGNRIAFDGPGGQPRLTTSVPAGLRIGFTGHNHDDELGLINMNGRLYDPTQRRFISPDPFGQDPLDGQSYNRYASVYNDPINMTDPSGFDGGGDGGGDGDGDGDGDGNGNGDGHGTNPAPPAPRDPQNKRDFQVRPAKNAADPTSTAARGLRFDEPSGRSTSGKGGEHGLGHGHGHATAPTPASDGPASTGAGDPALGTPTSSPSAAAQPGGQPGKGGEGPGTTPGSGNGSSNGPAGPSVGGYNPAGSTAPNAAPNGVQDPQLNWRQRAFQSLFPNTTMNPDTRDALEGLAILASVLVPVLGELGELTAVDEAIDEAEEISR